ncbi:hypothetical protein BDZ91DRAFT_538750 [Kalaharituber pfeilii]|nr:hypothetical protein BDZ91DRAFT_538750 [Kalaharituber pfeilii]
MENLLSIFIFANYFLNIFVCFAWIFWSLLEPEREHRRNGGPTNVKSLRASIVTFSLLTLTALLLTWYHMIRFFELSYTQWDKKADPDIPRTMGYWLRDTKLFEEAYRNVVMTPERWWWSQQIFLACFGWGIWLSYQGAGGVKRAGGKGRSKVTLVAYMVIAQLVAVSVAVGLFFVDALTHRAYAVPLTSKKQKEKEEAQEAQEESGLAKVLLTIYLMLSFLPTSALPTLMQASSGTLLNKLFFPALLLPHVALFIPMCFVHPVSRRFTRLLYTCSTAGSVVCHAAASGAVLKDTRSWMHAAATAARIVGGGGGEGSSGLQLGAVVVEAIKRQYWMLVGTHPAVSSVGSDVVMFVVCVAMWAGMEGGAREGMWVGGEEGKRQTGRKVGLWKRVGRVLLASGMMAVGGAGVGALMFAGDL